MRGERCEAMAERFKGKTVLVTGGGSGLGRLMCQRFAEMECTVVTCDIRMGSLEEVCERGALLGVFCVCWSHVRRLTVLEDARHHPLRAG